MQPAIVLCLDDEELLLHMLEATLTAHGYAVLTASTARQALKVATVHRPDAVILDYCLPDMNGGEVASEVKRLRPRTPIIMFSGADDIPSSALASVDGLVRKGESTQALLGILHRLLHRAGSESIPVRRVPRYSVQFPFSIVTDRSGKLEMFQGVSTDISEAGIGGKVNGTLFPGEKVLLHISRETEVVTETRPAQVRHQTGGCCGFAFLDIPTQQHRDVLQPR